MNNSLDGYFELLNSKFFKFQDILKLTLLQYNLIDGEDFDGLDDNLDERGILIDEIKLIDQDLKRFSIDGFDPDELNKQKEIENNILKIKEKVVLCNSELKNKMLEKKEECREQIRNLGLNRKAVSSYYNFNYEFNSTYIDRKN